MSSPAGYGIPGCSCIIKMAVQPHFPALVPLRSWKPFGFLFSVWRLFCLSGGPSVLCHQYLTTPQGGGRGESPLGRAGKPIQDGNRSYTPTRLPSAFSALFMISIVFSVLLEFQIFGLNLVPKLLGSIACKLCPPTSSCPLLGETLDFTEPHSGLWPQFAQAGSEHAGWEPGMAHHLTGPQPRHWGYPLGLPAPI